MLQNSHVSASSELVLSHGARFVEIPGHSRNLLDHLENDIVVDILLFRPVLLLILLLFET